MRLVDSALRRGIHWALLCAVAAGLLWTAGTANAVPVLQVGAPGGPGEGTYADYGNGTNPAEEDTAFTSGGTIYVSGLYQQDDVLNLGGKHSSGPDWSAIKYQGNNFFPSVFNGHGAVLVVSVPDGSLQAPLSLTVNGNAAFHTSESESFFPNNHDPVKDAIADFLFFDIGQFLESVAIPDFDTEVAGSKLGQIKTLLIAGFGGLAWIHFDVLALQTSLDGTVLVSTLQNNPGSHDVTWKPNRREIEVPEPGTLTLLGAGLLGLGILLRRRGA